MLGATSKSDQFFNREPLVFRLESDAEKLMRQLWARTPSFGTS